MVIALVLVLAELWLVLLWLLGVPTLVKGRVVLFVVGILVPLLWAVGALLPARS